RPRGDGVPAAGVAGARRDPVRHHHDVRGARSPARRATERDPRRGCRDRRQPAADRPSLPPRDRRRRIDARVRGRRRAQGTAAHPRGCAAADAGVTGGDGMTLTDAQARRRVADTEWAALAAELDVHGSAPTGPLLTPAECRDLAALYEKPEL